MSKDLKLKDLVLEHYRKVYETKMDGVTVRVFKPKTMGKLPTYAMLDALKTRAYDAKGWAAIERNRKVQWWLGNPDFGVWDAQIVRRFDPRQMTLDIYFAALLIRPFSRQAFEWYEAHSLTTDPVARLILMWDSRMFDRNGCYDTSYGAYKNQKEVDKYIYSGIDVAPYECITDLAFDPEFVPNNMPDQPGFIIKYRHKDGNIETETLWPLKPELIDKMQKYLKPTLQNFLDFTKDNPDIPEMHYFTDLTQWEKDLEEDEES